MKKIDLDESKSLQVSILENIHSFCEKNNLTYSLAYGALIGAIRHGGFIPWDDDIDIVMPRKDYTFFLMNYCDEKGIYKVHSLANDLDYKLPFAKVEDTRTILKEKSSSGNHFGISIDVLPIDLMGVDMESSIKIVSRLKLLKFIYKGKLVIPNSRNSFIKKIGIWGIKILAYPISLRYLAQLIDRKCSSIGVSDAKFLGCLCWGYEEHEIMPRSYFNEYTKIKFEGKEFFTFKDWNSYLTHLYGDYMKLPPEEKRCSPHEITNMFWK